MRGARRAHYNGDSTPREDDTPVTAMMTTPAAPQPPTPTAREARPFPGRHVFRPVPPDCVRAWTLRDGTPVSFAPARPSDGDWLARFQQALSDRSACQGSFVGDKAIALMALRLDGHGRQEVVGLGRLVEHPSADALAFTVVVADRFRDLGLGTELLRRLVAIARQQGHTCLVAEIPPDNHGVLAVCRKLGFDFRYDRDRDVIMARLGL